MPKLINSPAPQTVNGPAVSARLGHTAVYVQASTDCFVCVSSDGTGVDGQAVSATNAHFLPGGTGILLENIDPAHKIGVNTGTLYISAVN